MEKQVIYHPDFFVIPEGGEKPYLIALRCEKCGKTWFPILPYCPNCWSDKFSKRELRKGKLYTYTIMHTPQKGITPPLAFGYIDFPEEGVRVGAQIDVDVQNSQDQIKIGMEMEVKAGVIREDTSGKGMISYKFTPVV